MDARPLNEYPAKELEALQLSLSIAYQANSELNGKDCAGNLLIMRWADRVNEALKESEAQQEMDDNGILLAVNGKDCTLAEFLKEQSDSYFRVEARRRQADRLRALKENERIVLNGLSITRII